jgi:hypothetical protein
LVLAIGSFYLPDAWAALAANAAVTLLLVPPLVSVQLNTEKVMQLQPTDLEGLPPEAARAMASGKTIPTRRAAQYYKGEILAEAQTWLSGVEEGHLLPQITADNLRLCLAQHILWEGEHSADQSQARRLAAWPPTGENNEEAFQFLFSAGQLIQAWLRENGFQYEKLGVGTHPRPRGKDMHVVRFVRTDGKFLTVNEPTWLDGFSVLMKRESEGWRVANIGAEDEPASGWPPQGIGFIGRPS